MNARSNNLIPRPRPSNWLAVTATALLALAMPAATLAAGTLDQSQTLFGSLRSLIGIYPGGAPATYAQTFTSGLSGTLDRVDLPLRVVGNPGVPLVVEIRSLDSVGNPAGPVLGSANVASADLPHPDGTAWDDYSPHGDYTTFSFQIVQLTTPAPVLAGVSYAIVLSAPGANPDIFGGADFAGANRYEWAGTSSDAYAPGQHFVFFDSAWTGTAIDDAFKTYVASGPTYAATVQQPINANGSSVFKAGKGVIPVKFVLAADGAPTCTLPAATIVLTQTSGASPGVVNESDYTMAADTGSDFRISNCQFVYNLSTKSLLIGTYQIEIQINGQIVGGVAFELR
jgi:hypothetical protein